MAVTIPLGPDQGKFFELVIFFSAESQGWTEKWYFVNQGGDGYANGMAALSAYSVARETALGEGAFIQILRVSDLNVQRDRARDVQVALPIIGAPGAVNRDQAGAGWRMEASSQNVFWRQVWFRGCPDDWILWDLENADWVRPAALLDAAQLCLAKIIAGNLLMKVIIKDAAPLQITGFTFDPATYLVRFDTIGPQAALGDQMLVKGLQGTAIPGTTTNTVRQFNGKYQVVASSATSFTGVAPRTISSPYLYLRGGKAYNQKPGFARPDTLLPIVPATRRTGRAFLVPRGRRPNKR